MKTSIPQSIFSFVFILMIACREKQSSMLKVGSIDSIISKKTVKWIHPKREMGKDSIWSDDWAFMADSVFHGHRQMLKYYFSKYNEDTCVAMINAKAFYLPDFEGILPIGKIKGNRPADSVFVLDRLSWCDNDGDAYYFTDTSLPRLETESYCCHPNNLFNIGDIDEDGVAEIAQWNSSCVSKYKSLFVWTLKNHHWKKVGACTILVDEFDKMKQRIKKTGKGEFEMFDVADDYPEPRKGKWIHFKM